MNQPQVSTFHNLGMQLNNQLSLSRITYSSFNTIMLREICIIRHYDQRDLNMKYKMNQKVHYVNFSNNFDHEVIYFQTLRLLDG